MTSLAIPDPVFDDGPASLLFHEDDYHPFDGFDLDNEIHPVFSEENFGEVTMKH